MFALSIHLTPSSKDELKADLGRTLRHVKSSHRCEALARGLGFSSHAALLASIRSNKADVVHANGSAFNAYLSAQGFLPGHQSFYAAVARVAVKEVTHKEPRLTYSGIGIEPIRLTEKDKRETASEYVLRVRRAQNRLLSDEAISEFLLCRAFLNRVPRTRTIRPNSNSYWLKHVVENYDYSYPEGGELGPRYVANGAFIAAAISAGFIYKAYKDHGDYLSMNAGFNMSKRALYDLDCEIRPDGTRAQERNRKEQERLERARIMQIARQFEAHS